uniref:Hexosyltransferase n=1 Tax=Alexandrium monilatum TaxID=311494 RepID=A0A7S4TAX9_9DINO
MAQAIWLKSSNLLSGTSPEVCSLLMGFAGRLPLALSLLASAWSLRSREGPPPQTLFAEPPAGYTFQRFGVSEDGKSACGLFHFETKADITQHDVVVAVATYAGRHEMMRSKHYPFHTQQLPPGALLVYFTNSAMEGQMISATDNSTDTSYQAAQDRFMHVWRFVASDCLGTGRMRWFLMLDDDAVVSFGRLGIFMRAFEKTVGDPLKQQQLLGRTTTWMKRPEVFGGNGIPCSCAAPPSPPT